MGLLSRFLNRSSRSEREQDKRVIEELSTQLATCVTALLAAERSFNITLDKAYDQASREHRERVVGLQTGYVEIALRLKERDDRCAKLEVALARKTAEAQDLRNALDLAEIALSRTHALHSSPIVPVARRASMTPGTALFVESADNSATVEERLD